MIVLKDEDEAARACSELDKKTIGSRWIGVSPAELRKGGGGGRRRDQQEQEAYWSVLWVKISLLWINYYPKLSYYSH